MTMLTARVNAPVLSRREPVGWRRVGSGRLRLSGDAVKAGTAAIAADDDWRESADDAEKFWKA
jgi:hypothetical protein